MANWIMRVVILGQIVVLSRASLSKLNCFEIFHTDTSAILTCSEGVIASVDVKSGRGSCNKTEGRCYGNTASLLVDNHKCYWRNTCDVKWPSGLIIAPENDWSCFGKRPTFMEISYKCFTTEQDKNPKRLLFDICNNLVDGLSVYERAVTRNSAGLIRSHKSYPWNYSNDRRFCSMKFYWPINQKLVVTVHNVDLSEGDTLVIGNDGNRNEVSDGGTFYFLDNTETFFNFSVGIDSNNGAGFVLCFKFLDSNDRTVTDACRAVMDDGVFEPMHPRCKRRRTEKQRRKCNARYRARGARGENERKKNNKEKEKKQNRKMRNARNKRTTTDASITDAY